MSPLLRNPKVASVCLYLEIDLATKKLDFK